MKGHWCFIRNYHLDDGRKWLRPTAGNLNEHQIRDVQKVILLLSPPWSHNKADNGVEYTGGVQARRPWTLKRKGILELLSQRRLQEKVLDLSSDFEGVWIGCYLRYGGNIGVNKREM